METSNLCAKIPVELHQKIRAKQQESELPLGDYMTKLLENYFKMMEEKPMSNKTRTIAVQVTDEDFYRLKAHMKRTGEKQKEFFHKAIFDIITAAERDIPAETLQDQILDAEISGEKKSRNRNQEEPHAEEEVGEDRQGEQDEQSLPELEEELQAEQDAEPLETQQTSEE